ncbi:MAG: LpxL/LpxP family Kdo(2)-lipid IV(A) lauroyl/palmitoleoyl acyltransferase [Xanthomonadales bacterium]
MQTESLERPPLTPKYWAGWLGIGLFWLIGKLPQRLCLGLSAPLAWLMKRLMRRRQAIAVRNVERCFPECNTGQHKAIVDDCFRSLARAVFEIAWSCSASRHRILRISEVKGLDNLLEARQQGRGVLLITAHISCLEIGGRIFAQSFPGVKGMYRPLKSPVLEWYQLQARAKYSAGMISKRDMRSAIRYLREGGVMWYAPDQDFGPEQSVFVPFFGIQTATLLATHRLIRLTGCAVVPMFPSYDPETRHYTVSLLPPIEDFPGDDPVPYLEKLNQIMEDQIRYAPGQYWWVHRRFKTRPEGEPPFYRW